MPNLTISHLNCAGTEEVFLSYLEFHRKNKTDIIIAQDFTRIKKGKNTKNPIPISNYTYYTPRHTAPRLVIYANKQLAQSLSVFYQYRDIALGITIYLGGKQTNIVSLYSPRIPEHIPKAIRDLSTNIKAILIGDLNLHNEEWSSNTTAFKKEYLHKEATTAINNQNFTIITKHNQYTYFPYQEIFKLSMIDLIWNRGISPPTNIPERLKVRFGPCIP